MSLQLSRPGSLQRKTGIKISESFELKWIKNLKPKALGIFHLAIPESFQIMLKKRKTTKTPLRRKWKAVEKCWGLLILVLDQSITPLFILPFSLLFIPAGCRGRCGLDVNDEGSSSFPLSSSEHVLFLSSASIGCSAIHPLTAGHTPQPPSHTEVESVRLSFSVF